MDPILIWYDPSAYWRAYNQVFPSLVKVRCRFARADQGSKLVRPCSSRRRPVAPRQPDCEAATDLPMVIAGSVLLVHISIVFNEVTAGSLAAVGFFFGPELSVLVGSTSKLAFPRFVLSRSVLPFPTCGPRR
jgi:hypothetical protein